MNGTKKDFTNLLIEKGLISKEQLDEIYNLHTQRKEPLSELLVRMNYVDEKDLTVFLSTYLSIPPVKILNLRIPPDILKIIPKEFAQKYRVLPIGKIGSTLTVATLDPLNVVIFEDLEKLTGYEINLVIALPSELKQALDFYYKESVTTTIEEIIKDSDAKSFEIILSEEEEIKDEEILRSIDEAPVIKLTNYILKKAVQDRTSDVLIETVGNNARVRFRIDGILREGQAFPKKMYPFVISRIKIMANLNITEHRLPQDGRFRINITGNYVDFRVSIIPSTLGEKIALRILDKSTGILNLDALGYEDDTKAALKKDALSSYGMLLVSGPTGSGKTTTLYSLLRHIFTPEKNITTVEDPIEYQLEGINQVNTNYEVKLTFSSALRSILRQDPDVIMIGEIRDFDTVDIAIKAALTGHLVLSTIHTTTASGSITRLINMGEEAFLLASTLIGVLAQRLIRKLCPKCKEINEIPDEMREKLKLNKTTPIYKAKGCKYCGNLGYKGRVAVSEYLHLNPIVRQLINDGGNEHNIKKEARKQGMRTLREDGIIKIEKGLTTLEEVIKVTAADEE